MSLDPERLGRLGRPCCRVVVAEAKGSAPREAGAEMLVFADEFEGTIGGGALEFEALAEARRRLARRAEGWVAYPLGPALGQCCGGAVVLVYEIWDAGRAEVLCEGEYFVRRIGDGSITAPRSEAPVHPASGLRAAGVHTTSASEAPEGRRGGAVEAPLGCTTGAAEAPPVRRAYTARPDAYTAEAPRPMSPQSGRRSRDDPDAAPRNGAGRDAGRDAGLGAAPSASPDASPEAAPVPASPLPLPLRGALKAARSGKAPGVVWAAPWLGEPVAAWRAPLWLWGAGHVGRAVVRAFDGLPFSLTWIDDAAERFPDAPPGAAAVRIAPRPAALAAEAPAEAAHLVMTYSHAMDLEIAHALLARGAFARLGVIGSATKAARFRARLRALGHSDAAVARLEMPIGLRGPEGLLGGKAPAEIAVSVAADHLAWRAARGRAAAAEV